MKSKINHKKKWYTGLFIFFILGIGFVLITYNNPNLNIISNQNKNETVKENEKDPTVYVKEDEANTNDEKQKISSKSAEDIVKEKVEGGQVLYSEYRNSSDISYYLVRITKDGEEINVYVDSQSGEILYESKE